MSPSSLFLHCHNRESEAWKLLFTNTLFQEYPATSVCVAGSVMCEESYLGREENASTSLRGSTECPLKGKEVLWLSTKVDGGDKSSVVCSNLPNMGIREGRREDPV